MMTDFSMNNIANDWEMMSFVRHNKTVGDEYLVPTKMQDFRLVTGAPIYGDYKSTPYIDTDVLDWHRRQRVAGKFYRTIDFDLLAEIVLEDGITHVVLEANIPAPPCSFLHELHQDDHYKIFIINIP